MHLQHANRETQDNKLTPYLYDAPSMRGKEDAVEETESSSSSGFRSKLTGRPEVRSDKLDSDRLKVHGSEVRGSMMKWERAFICRRTCASSDESSPMTAARAASGGSAGEALFDPNASNDPARDSKMMTIFKVFGVLYIVSYAITPTQFSARHYDLFLSCTAL